jgi:hypothetical protein
MYRYIRCTYSVFSREITLHTVIYGADILFWPTLHTLNIGLARTIDIRCIYGIFGKEIAKDTVIYGVYMRFWPTLCVRLAVLVQIL